MVLSELPALISPENKTETTEANYLCLISQVENQLVVWDLGGKTGTFVNGSRVTRATLKDSDTLGFGGSEFRVHADQPVKRYVYGPRN
jgi:pSer/pThr/pTyr-binding forkhead associated (FHA) protein